MLLPALESIYRDAMIVESLYDIADLFTKVQIRKAISEWKNISKDIEDFIPRMAQKSIDQGQRLFDCWKSTLEVREDFRLFSSEISTNLIPCIIESINVLYGPIELNGEKWIFNRTTSGFINVRDVKNNRCYHSPFDPMREASILADSVYGPEMDEYHILGCGLGYFPYQVWLKSDESAHIYIYEDDSEMLEYADQFGVLSWIDKDMLTIVDYSDKEKLLTRFIGQYNKDSDRVYISDWKAEGYYNGQVGELLKSIDFGLRTIRTNEKKWKINERENRKQNPKKISAFFSDYDFKERDCIIVSAGPSLDNCIEFLRKNINDKTIIAVNTVLLRLEKEGIKPDIVVMLADDDSLCEHIEGVENYFSQTPLVMPLSGSRTFTALYRGPIYAMEEEDLLDTEKWDFSGTVTSLALNLAYNLRAKKIYLIGSDLAYTGGKNFSSGVAHDEYSGMIDNILVDSNDGGKVQTDNLYIAFRKILERQIMIHPEAEVYNMSEHGARIAGAIMAKM